MFGTSALPTVAADPQAARILVGRPLYIIIDTVEPIPSTPPVVPAGWTPTWVYRWTSEAQMAADFTAGTVPTWITVAMYDNELVTEPPTPANEQVDPPMYTKQAAAIAHAAGRIFMPTAGLQTSDPNYPGGPAQEQIDYWNTSNTWNGYAMQTQTGENVLQQFESNISSLSAKALADNRALFFSAGVGDFAGGTFAQLPQIEAAINVIPAGYRIWMNFGLHNGVQCTDPTVCPIPPRYDMIVSIIDFFG